MAKVSVIIPVYNVEKYLERCLESICNQTFKDLEIICVNDGSQDNCKSILHNYSKKDDRIIVINKANGGLSSARNSGIKVATGKYIYFIDPDDYIELYTIKYFYEVLEQNNCDVVVGGYTTNPTSNKIIPKFNKGLSLNPIQLIRENYYVHSHNDLCFVWRYIYRLDLIKKNNIRFDEEIRVGEDFIFNLEAICKSKSIYVLSDSFYNYTIDNNTSIMRIKYKEKLELSLIRQYNIKKNLSKKYKLFSDKKYRFNMAEYYINSFLPMILKNLYNGPEEDKKVAIKRILNYEMFRDSFKEIGYSYECNNIKEYIAYLIMKFRIYPLAYKIIDKQYRVV